MFADIVLFTKNREVEDLEKQLGFTTVLFREDLKPFNISEGGDYDKNRKILENKRTDILLNPESLKNSSDINHILCKLAHDNNIIIAFSLAKLKNENIFNKIISDIKLFRKYKVKCAIASFAREKYDLRNSSDIISLGKVMGMTPKEAKDSLIHIYNLYKEKTDKTRISKGIRLIKPALTLK